jgi:internalin A
LKGSLPVSDVDLALIPETVTGLALVNAPVTNEGIRRLLRLTGLRRLNIAGTQITDEGLSVLVRFENLEWVCVNRTGVTAAGVDRLKEIGPA